MKALLSVLLLLPLSLAASSRRAQDQEPHEEPETELAGHMEVIEDTVKLLRKSLKEPLARADALQAIAEIQALTLKCKLLTPAAAQKLPEAEREAFVTAFRRTMVDFLTRQLELEAALLDGDAERAKTAFERFREMEDSAHERFAPDDG